MLKVQHTLIVLCLSLFQKKVENSWEIKIFNTLIKENVCHSLPGDIGGSG